MLSNYVKFILLKKSCLLSPQRAVFPSDLCAPNPCNNNGKCEIFDRRGFTCDCSSTGFTGPTCTDSGKILFADFLYNIRLDITLCIISECR